MALQKTALVVETNYVVASVIEGTLAQSGFRVVVALDEKEARAEMLQRAGPPADT